MRDIELEPLPPAVGPPVVVGDSAFARLPPGGVNVATGLVDPGLLTDVAFAEPSPGGEFGPGRAQLVSGPVDGGLADMDDGAVVAAPVAPIAKPAYALAGRSWNAATPQNLFPWKYGLGGLDSKNPPAVAGEDPPPASPITFTNGGISNGTGSVMFAGLARADAVLHVIFRVGSNADRDVIVDIDEGDTAAHIATLLRAALNGEAQIGAAGTGATVSVFCNVPGVNLTKFEVSLI